MSMSRPMRRGWTSDEETSSRRALWKSSDLIAMHDTAGPSERQWFWRVRHWPGTQRADGWRATEPEAQAAAEEALSLLLTDALHELYFGST